MDRRKLIRGGVSAFIFSITLWPRFVCAEQSANITWNVPRSQVQAVKEALDFQGKITPKPNPLLDTRGLPLLFVFAGTVAISTLARALLDVYKDMRYGGIVVSVRDGQLNIKNDVRLYSGTIIVYNDKNIKVYELTQTADTDVGPLVKSLNDIASSKPTK